MQLENKIALVTGASRGIGKAIAIELASLGAIVVGTATTDSGAQNITEMLSEMPAKGLGLVMNVSDGESVQSAVAAMVDQVGAASILVNNAGITRDNLFMRMKEPEWDDVINTNLNSLYRVSKACIKPMIKARQGRIINVGSVVAAMGNAGQTNYCAAKAGLEGFTRSLAKEIGARGITVNAITPGFIRTDMTDALEDAQKELMLAQVPLARLGEVEDIAKTVAFIAGDGAAYISGATIPVNGGMYM